MDISFDAIHWELDGTDLKPLVPSKALNYPLPEDVKYEVVYGFDDQYEGEMVGGNNCIIQFTEPRRRE
jgi:hypothetical protein